MEYELREITSKDIFPMVKLISKFGIDEFKTCFDPKLIKEIVDENGEIKGDKLFAVIGMNVAFDIASIVLTNIGNCEDEIFDFLASVSNLKRKEVEKMSPADFAQMIIDFIQKDEFKDFFGVVSKLLK